MGVRRVAVVGDLNVDVISFHRDFPSRGSESLAERVIVRAGGTASNFSIAMSALGIRARPVAAVGTDPLGDFVLSELSAHGAETLMVRRTPIDSTGICHVVVTFDERTMLTYRGANRLLNLSDREIEELKGFDAVHLSGYALLEGPQRESAVRLLRSREVRDVGLITLDLCPPFARHFDAGLLGLIRDVVDVLFLNELELEGLLGMARCGSAGELAALLDVVLVLKRGRMGAVVHLSDGTSRAVEPEPVDGVNPTGAGDAFAAGFVAGLLEGRDPDQAAELGCRIAGAAVRSLSWGEFASRVASERTHL